MSRIRGIGDVVRFWIPVCTGMTWRSVGAGRGPKESCRASSICVTSLGDSGLAEGASRSASTPLSSASGVGSGLGETCLGHLPNALSVRMLAAAMRSLVVAFSSQSLAMSRRISMSSRPLLVTSSMELAKSSAGFDGGCWVVVVMGSPIRTIVH